MTSGQRRWERRKQDRPKELIASALALFVERGYAATRLDEVAARAGVSKGTLYLYFPSKQELFKAVVRQTIVPLIDQYRRDLQQADGDSAMLLERFFRDWWERFGSTRLAGIAKLIVAEAGNFPEVARFFHEEVIEPNGAVLLSILDRGVRRGEFSQLDPRTTVQLCMAPLVLRAIWANSLDAFVPPDQRIEPERFLRAHTDFVLASLRVAPQTAPTAGPGRPARKTPAD